MPVIVLSGEEEFRIAREVEALKKRLIAEPALAAFNFRVSSCDLKEMIDAAASLPLGSGNRMVLFENCSLFTKKRAASAASDDEASAARDKPAKLLEDLEHALAHVHANTYLVFALTSNFDSTLKISKIFAKHAQLSKFDKVKYFPGAANRDLLDFCNKEAHRFEACIEDQAAFYLAESTECDLRQISCEIQKAATYILPGKTIKLDDVSKLSPHFSHVFSLMDHWASGRKQDVLLAIQELRSRQASPHMVIAAAQTVLSKWIGYKTQVEEACAVLPGSRDVRRKEIPLHEIARSIAFEPRMAFVVEQDLKRISTLTLGYLSERKRELTELEYLLKSGQMPETHALEHFFTR